MAYIRATGGGGAGITVNRTYNSATKKVTFQFNSIEIKFTDNGNPPQSPSPCGGYAADTMMTAYIGVVHGKVDSSYSANCFPNLESLGILYQVSQQYSTTLNLNPFNAVVDAYDYNNYLRGKNIALRGYSYNIANPSSQSGWWITTEQNGYDSAFGYCYNAITTDYWNSPTYYGGSEPPLAPATPTFTLANYYDGLDSVKLTITSNTVDVDYWSILRSNTYGGTYVEIGQQLPADGQIYYDDNVIVGNTYYYKIQAINEMYTGTSAIQSITVAIAYDDSCVIRNTASIINVTSGDTSSRYELWRSTSEFGTYTRVGATLSGGTPVYDKVTTYNATYWYKIKQVTPNWSLWSTATQYTGTLSMSDSPVLSGIVNTGTTSIDLSWTDSNTWQQEYEIYRQANNGGYVLIDTVTGDTYHAIISVGVLYDFKIRGKISCFAPTYIYSPYSNQVTYSITPVITPPTGVTTTSLSCTGGTLNWVNTNVSGQTGNYVKQWNGTGYTIIATLSSGATSYIVTGLTPNTSYNYAIFAYNAGREAESETIVLTTLDPAPFNLNGTLSTTTAVFTWDINDHPYGTAIRPEYRVQGDTIWITRPLIAHDAVQYNYTGLSWSTTYEFRLVRIGSEYPSDIYVLSTTYYEAPSDLVVTTIGDKQICLEWTVNSYNVNQVILYRKENEAWQDYQYVANTTTSICVTGLSMLTQYTFQVANRYDVYRLYSNQVQATTTVTFLPPFCANEAYTVINTTCGNSDGRIEMLEDYTIFYNFTLTDVQGNSYVLTDYYWTGLTANWYTITATVLPQWYFHYGVESCVLNWIPLEDVDTTISLLDTKIKNAVCGGFGGAKGRIIYQFTDNSDATTWTFTLYNERYEQVNQQVITATTFTGTTNIQYVCSPDIYYGILENNNGCTYLIDLTQVPSDRLYTVAGIQRLFITPWTTSLYYNYYDSSSDDWYVAGIDTQQFTSTKIKEFQGLSDFWYEIKLDTANMVYNQSLNRGQNGIVYNEQVTVTIPRADNAKWKQLVNVLTQRYTIVFQDSHDQWWTCFYRSGAEVKNYRLEENMYSITFSYPATQIMLTALDYNYVKLNIL
jgi:hypothetical protein